MHRRRRSGERRREYALLLCAAILFLSGVFLVWISSFEVPDLTEFASRKVAESTKLYDRTGTVPLYDLHQDIRRTIVPFGDISRRIKNATVAIEDSEFYQHRGIKPTAILRAIFANLGAGGWSQGGSTITQQVVKNSLLTSEKRISRKLKEWVLAVKLERMLTKEEILGLYLNEAPYGGDVYGVEEASEMYFGKHAADVTIAEAAYLASLPNAPTYYSPYGNNKAKLDERKNLVLKRMRELTFIREDEYQSALAERVAFKPQEVYGIRAPHFVIFVKGLLEQKFGEEAVSERGFRVITTLDWRLQEAAEKTVKEYALRNKETFNAENAALVAIDPKTGGILAMVGSRDYFDTEIDGNFNVALAHRQPGSAFKPFAYATAFNKGYTPETAIFDVPTEFSVECNPDGTPIAAGTEDHCYSPHNYDEKFRGPMTFRAALAQSINVPSVKVLYLAGLPETLRLAKDMGIGSLGNAGEYGLTLVLGGGEVSLLDLTSAYSVFANGGERNPWNAILRIEDKDGNPVEEFERKPSRVLSEETAARISDILSDNDARGPSFGGVFSPLYFKNASVAAKTGTTNDYRDAWVVGYTPALAVGAWAGNNDNSPMEKKVAGFIVAPLWRAFMDGALKVVPPEPFREPPEEQTESLPAPLKGLWQGGSTYSVDKISGKLATEFTPPELREERAVRQVHSILYWIDKDAPRAGKPEHPESDPQFERWEYGVRKWAAENGFTDETEVVIPKENDPVHRPELSPTAAIVAPLQNARLPLSGTTQVKIKAAGAFPITTVDLFVNGVYVASSNRSPWNLSFVPADAKLREGDNELSVVVYDAVRNRAEARLRFTVAP